MKSYEVIQLAYFRNYFNILLVRVVFLQSGAELTQETPINESGCRMRTVPASLFNNLSSLLAHNDDHPPSRPPLTHSHKYEPAPKATRLPPHS